MLNQRLESYVNQLDVDDKMKQFLMEILIFEFNHVDKSNYRYLKIYSGLIDKYTMED